MHLRLLHLGSTRGHAQGIQGLFDLRRRIQNYILDKEVMTYFTTSKITMPTILKANAIACEEILKKPDQQSDFYDE
jgi:hypothetical protein